MSDRARAPREQGGEPTQTAPAGLPKSALPLVALTSLALHGVLALVLVSLPMTTSMVRELDATWLSFDVETLDVAPTPEPIAAPLPEPAPVIVPRERPQPARPEPQHEEIAPQPEIHAPPSLDDVFAEPPPPMASLTTDGPGAFAVASGEPGGVAGGTVGGHGTSLVSTARPGVEIGPSDADRRRARRTYVQAIEDLVRAHTRYPRAAGREGLQGRVELALRIGNDGHVLAIRVASSSGHGILDDAALDAAREIARVPAPPLVASLTSTDEVRVGVVYVVR